MGRTVKHFFVLEKRKKCAFSIQMEAKVLGRCVHIFRAEFKHFSKTYAVITEWPGDPRTSERIISLDAIVRVCRVKAVIDRDLWTSVFVFEPFKMVQLNLAVEGTTCVRHPFTVNREYRGAVHSAHSDPITLTFVSFDSATVLHSHNKATLTPISNCMPVRVCRSRQDLQNCI